MSVSDFQRFCSTSEEFIPGPSHLQVALEPHWLVWYTYYQPLWNWSYRLVILQSYWKWMNMAIEIVSLLTKNVIFHEYLRHYQQLRDSDQGQLLVAPTPAVART